MNEGYFSSLTNEFLESKDFNDSMNYTNSYNTIEELFEDNIIGHTEGTELYDRKVRVFNPAYNQYGYITTACRVIYEPVEGIYNLDTIGVKTFMPVSNAIDDITHALGLKAEQEGYYSEIINAIQNDESFIDGLYIDTLITKNKIFTYPSELIEKIRNYILSRWGEDGTPVECPYNYTQNTYSEGQGTLVDWNNNSLPEVSSALQFNNEIAGYNYKNFFEELNRLKEEDEDVKRIFNYPNVRIGIRTPAFPTDTRICICGMSLANNDIITSSENEKNQHYGVRVTYVDWVEFNTSSQYYPDTYPKLTKILSNKGNVNIGETLYNYPRDVWLPNGLMIGTSAVVHFSRVIDSIGFTGEVKPYSVLPNATPPRSGTTMDENYPEWQPIINILRPVSVNVTIQDWRGIPDVNIVYNLPPIINLTKIEIIEINGPDTELDDPENSDYGLFTIYFPDNDDMQEITGHLWDENILDKILRIFKNNPMDAVISLHEVYMIGAIIDGGTVEGHTYTGIKSGEKPVYFGNVKMTDGDVSYTTKRYIKLTMGELRIDKEFDDIRDFERDVEIFLPFIGFQSINISDVTSSRVKTTTLKLDYVVDILTGDLIANLYVNRDGLTDKKFMYSWSGNMASILPLSSNDKSRLFNGVVGAVGSIATAFATGGASLLPSAIGAGTSLITGSQSQIQRSGNISGNTGCMNYKEAFLLINNPRPLDVTFNDLAGFSTNLKARLSSVTGFARIKECHVDTIPNASDQEKSMIESLLKQGIIL